MATVDVLELKLEELLLEDERESYLKSQENGTTSNDKPASPGKQKKGKMSKKDLSNWGFPGYLTTEDLGIYVQFRDEVEKRGGEFKNTVYSFTLKEGEAYTLTRWLRARKYNLADTIKMVEEATECRSEARAEGFYPDPAKTLGVDPAIFISQYPQLYSGVGKNGCPVFYSKPGVLDIDGVECITSKTGFLKYHWHVMQHDYLNRLLKYKEENPEFTRFECISILDLKNLTMAQLSKRTLDIIKKQSAVDSLCYPETMNKMVIVNAPTFFSVTWKLIKGWIDARTVSKVDLFSSKSAAEKRLKELIDLDQLPKDYGGNGEDTNTTLAKSAKELGGVSRLVTELVHVRGKASINVTLAANEEMEVTIHTRGPNGSKFSIVDAKTKQTIGEPQNVVHNGPTDDEAMPTSIQLTPYRIQGPYMIKVKAESKSSRLSSEPYLVVGKIYEK